MMGAVIGKSGSKAVHELATLDERTVQGSPARCKAYHLETRKIQDALWWRPKLHPPRGTRAVGTPLTSATEAYSLTKLPLLPKRKMKITRPVWITTSFFFFF